MRPEEVVGMKSGGFGRQTLSCAAFFKFLIEQSCSALNLQYFVGNVKIFSG